VNAKAATSRASLSAVIKSARDVMRKDPGLNGDVDRIPQIAWLLFLKAFEDLEASRLVLERDYTSAIEEPFRWQDWAGPRAATPRSGDALITFVNANLLPHLAELHGSGKTGDSRDVIAAIFADTRNRMLSGYLLGDLIEQIDRVNFASSDDLHTMAHVYESMLREMRDAAGGAGEFYTPRPVVRFMVNQIDPRLGETVMDPAVGTGGFLVQAQEHLSAQVTTAADRARLSGALRGFEKKPLPYLLSQMNLLLHGAEDPRVTRENALAYSIRNMRAAGVNVVLTNPPFEGEEEGSIAALFPSGLRTAETSWLFLQAVMARIAKKQGRAAVVVPNGVLFADGVGGRIKKDLLEKFNLHTVVRLPNGTFSPYRLIPTNILFFEAGAPTDDIWFYEHPLPEGRKNYTKTKPLRYEEFADCEAWWGGGDRRGRVETEHAWKVSAAEVAANGHNLDLRNPNRPDDLEHRPVAELVSEIVRTEEELLDVLRSLQVEIAADATAGRTDDMMAARA
jgi:type I restriction enzyme M protein